MRSPFKTVRVLAPRVPRGAARLRRLVNRFMLVLLLTGTVLLLPTPEALSTEGHRALALFVFTGSILALEPVSLPIAALLVPLVQVGLGIGTSQLAFEPFSRPVVFLILGSMFLAEGLRKHGLTRRLALATLLATGGSPPRLLLGMMAISAVFSMWVHNTATAAMLIPVAMTIARQVEDPRRSKQLLVQLVLGIAYGCSLGGMVTVLGSSANAVAAGFLSQIRDWSFVDWMKYGGPSFVLLFPLTWWLLLRIVKVDLETMDLEPVRRRIEEIGGMTREEKELAATLGVAIVLWVGGGFFEDWLGLPNTLLSAAMVAVLAVGWLSARKVISWEDVQGVSWGIFLIIGAGLSLGEALMRTGATDFLATLIVPIIDGPPMIVSLLLLVYVSALLTNAMNNTTIAAVFTPVLITVAAGIPGSDPVQLVLPVTLATTFGYSLPSASGRMALVAASGIVDRGRMMSVGLIMTLVSSAVLGLLFWALTAAGLV
ncbi:MAG TPA: DASS family sodium-coupled anion symporter [Chondromyces sp.]|nr:DASS family sodium-coupled anion symporter [Chondromyces sp.]